MNYQECRAYIDDSAKYGSVLGLDNMREMLDRLGQAIKWADTYPQLFILTENVLRLPARRSHRKILQSM